MKDLREFMIANLDSRLPFGMGIANRQLEAVRKGDWTLQGQPSNKDLRQQTRGPVPFSDSLLETIDQTLKGEFS
jgi:hypothetical protein